MLDIAPVGPLSCLPLCFAAIPPVTPDYGKTSALHGCAMAVSILQLHATPQLKTAMSGL